MVWRPDRLSGLFPSQVINMMKRIRIRHHADHSEIQRPIDGLTFDSHPPEGYADLAYRTIGTGPEKLVLISGMCVSHEMWQFQETYFRNKPMFTTLFFDNRGSGDSSDSKSHLPSSSSSGSLNGYTIETMARDVWAVVDVAFGRDVHVHLVGHSMGSMIAQRAALSSTHGRRVTSLALLCGHDGGWFWNSAPSIRLIRASFTLLFDKCPHAQADAYLNLHFTQDYLGQDNGNIRHQLLKRYVDGLINQSLDCRHVNSGWDHLMAVRTHCLSPGDASTLRDRPYPKLVLYGSYDSVVMPRASRQLAGRIGARAIAVHASHFAMEEAKDEINRMLELHVVGAAILRHVAVAVGTDVLVNAGNIDGDFGNCRAQVRLNNLKTGRRSKSRDASPVSIIDKF